MCQGYFNTLLSRGSSSLARCSVFLWRAAVQNRSGTLKTVFGSLLVQGLPKNASPISTEEEQVDFEFSIAVRSCKSGVALAPLGRGLAKMIRGGGRFGLVWLSVDF